MGPIEIVVILEIVAGVAVYLALRAPRPQVVELWAASYGLGLTPATRPVRRRAFDSVAA